MRTIKFSGFGLVAGLYFLVFGSILVVSHGIPYAVDNNESFSSLWHSRNLFSHGLSGAKGLADESLGWSSASSPYVHTHQGNFPRIFAFLIYLLGARSIESQITVTTFTVGLAAIWMAYRFYRTIGPRSFATLACAVLICDYALFSQWQFNTYRVWYGFLFFSSLLWASRFNHFSRRTGILLGTLNFAALFYGEYVFASFVAGISALYLIFVLGRKLKALIAAWLSIVLGAASAAGLLLAQLTAYMGWANTVSDIRYTLAARNMSEDPSFASVVDRFYANRHIVFWHNYIDAGPLRAVAVFFESLSKKHLQYYGSWIVACAIILLLGWFLGRFASIFSTRAHSSSGDSAQRQGVQPRVADPLQLAQLLVQQGPYRGAFSVVLASLRNDAFRAVRLAVANWLRITLACALLLLSWYLLRHRANWFEDSVTHERDVLSLVPFPTWIAKLAYVLSVAAGIGFVLSEEKVPFRDRMSAAALFRLSVCALASYAVVYRLFTGYVYSGYLYRQAPFLVFWTDTLFAAALYLLVAEIGASLAHGLTSSNGGERRRWTFSQILTLASAPVVLVVLGGHWLSLQAEYVRIVPPTSYSFLQYLKAPPYHSATFAVNSYAAPMADQTHTWALDDSTVLSGRLKLGPDGFEVESSDEYVWFADSDHNPRYRKPEFGLIVHQPASISEGMDNLVRMDPSRDMDSYLYDFGIIRRCHDVTQAFLKDRIVATDGRTFCIIKFDWEYPPFLRAFDEIDGSSPSSQPFGIKFAGLKSDRDIKHRWRVEIAPGYPADHRSANPIFLAADSFLIDGKPLFSAKDFQSNGWSATAGEATRFFDGWIGYPGIAQPMIAVVKGERLSAKLHRGPKLGTMTLRINGLREPIDEFSASDSLMPFQLSADEPFGAQTAVPEIYPGTRVGTLLLKTSRGPEAKVWYSYAQQDGKPEEMTTIRIYNEFKRGGWRMIDSISFLGPHGIAVRMEQLRKSNPDLQIEYARVRGIGDQRSFEEWLADFLDTHPKDLNRNGIVSLPDEVAGPDSAAVGSSFLISRTVPLTGFIPGWLQISVTPGTYEKSGPEYFGLPFGVQTVAKLRSESPLAVVPEGYSVPDAYKANYGAIKLVLKFPMGAEGRSEPIVTSGFKENADFLYVKYLDSSHISFGFDHWFKGGPVTPPIAVDFSVPHRLEISMGSLYPAEDDPAFMGASDTFIQQVKKIVSVKMDGVKVLEAEAQCYESEPKLVEVAKNSAGGTTCGSDFEGTIISDSRFWPTPE